MPRADATELAPKKSAPRALPQFPNRGAGGLFAFRQRKTKKACISLVKLPSGGPGLLNAKIARQPLPGAPNAFCVGILVVPTQASILSRSGTYCQSGQLLNLRNLVGITERTPGVTNVTRYSCRSRCDASVGVYMDVFAEGSNKISTTHNGDMDANARTWRYTSRAGAHRVGTREFMATILNEYGLG